MEWWSKPPPETPFGLHIRRSWAGWLIWLTMKLLVRIGARPALANDLVNPSANPIINEQLAQLTQCQHNALALRERYTPGVSGRVMEYDMTADAAINAIDDIVLTLDRTRRDLVKTQRPLAPERLQSLLAYGRQLDELQRALG